MFSSNNHHNTNNFLGIRGSRLHFRPQALHNLLLICWKFPELGNSVNCCYLIVSIGKCCLFYRLLINLYV